jgi:hypothetical protein
VSHSRLSLALWDDEDFVEHFDDLTRTLWFLLLSGPQTGPLPGLYRSSVHSLAEALRRPTEAVGGALRTILATGKVEYDERRRVIRVRRAPKHNAAASPNHIKAWWTRWVDIPDCDAKFRHVESLREFAGLGNPKHAVMWAATFGTLPRWSEGAPPVPVEGPSEGPTEGVSKPSTVSVSVSVSGTASASDAPGGAMVPTVPTPIRRGPDWEAEAMRLRTLSDGKIQSSCYGPQAADFGRMLDSATRQHGRADWIELLARYAVEGDGFEFMGSPPTMASFTKNDGQFLFSSIEKALAWERDAKPSARIVPSKKPIPMRDTRTPEQRAAIAAAAGKTLEFLRSHRDD